MQILHVVRRAHQMCNLVSVDIYIKSRWQHWLSKHVLENNVLQQHYNANDCGILIAVKNKTPLLCYITLFNYVKQTINHENSFSAFGQLHCLRLFLPRILKMIVFREHHMPFSCDVTFLLTLNLLLLIMNIMNRTNYVKPDVEFIERLALIVIMEMLTEIAWNEKIILPLRQKILCWSHEVYITF